MLPTLSRLSVSNGPESRLRHRYSSRYLRISPLHREFCSPLPHSSLPVSKAIPRLSRGLSFPTEQAAYTRFTPSNSEQRLPPTFYRGCWHVVSGGFLCWYCHHTRVLTWIGFLPTHRVLRPEGLRHPRGVAGSGFRPLPKFLTAASRRSLARISVPVWPITLSGRLPIAGLVGHYPTNYLMGRGLLLE